jgi:hypothetical protein
MKTKLLLGSIIASFVGAIGMPLVAHAAPPAFHLQPFEFVGTAAECGVAGTDTVTAKWDNSVGNPAPSIFLEKQGATSNCAAAGVDIVTPLEGRPVSNLTELNFDYKDGGHCGAGAPRFNIQADGMTAFLGCTYGTHTNLGNGWVHVVFSPADIAAALVTAGIAPTATLEDLYIIFDEGTDTPSGGTIGTPGSVYLDNFSVNGQVVGSPTSPTSKDDCKNNGWKNFNPTFKNQGDCVSFVATKGKNQPSGPQVVVPVLATF